MIKVLGYYHGLMLTYMKMDD